MRTGVQRQRGGTIRTGVQRGRGGYSQDGGTEAEGVVRTGVQRHRGYSQEKCRATGVPSVGN